MDLSVALMLILIFLLLEGFFSGSEYLLISFNKLKLRHLAESGSTSAIILENLLKRPERVFGVTSIGTNICVFVGASVATAYLANLVGKEADLYSFLIMGPLTLTLGEIVPKILFRQKADFLSKYIAWPLEQAATLFAPVLFVTSTLAQGLLKLFFAGGGAKSALVTREELMLMTREEGGEIAIDQDERKMIHRIFEFRSSTVESVMRPLVNLESVSSTATIAEARELMARSGYSRLPVFCNRIFNIVGIITAFDILRALDQHLPCEQIMIPAYYTPSARRNSSLLRAMNEHHTHMAVVVDEYGGSVGVVTIEDLVEEIVGEIEDEYDSPIKYYEKIENARYVVDTMMEIDSLAEEPGLALPEGDYETVSGFLNDALERVPNKRDRLAVGSYLITVLEATPQRATSVEIVDLSTEQNEEPDEQGD